MPAHTPESDPRVEAFLAAIRDGTADIDPLIRALGRVSRKNIEADLEMMLRAIGLGKPRVGRLRSGLPMAVVVSDETWQRLYGDA